MKVLWRYRLYFKPHNIAAGLAELYAYQVHRLATVGEFVSVSHVLDLLQRPALRLNLDHLELKQKHLTVKLHRHVDAANVGGVCEPLIQSQRGKVAVKNADVITLIATHLVFAIPVVGNAGVKGVEEVFQSP